MKSKFLKTIGAISVLFVIGCNNNADIKMVKGGKLQMCPGKTVKEMVEGFMDSPSWSSGESENHDHFVNIKGGITYQEKPIKAEVQFFVDEKGGAFQFHALEFNGIPQNEFFANALLEKMCESK